MVTALVAGRRGNVVVVVVVDARSVVNFGLDLSVGRSGDR